MCGPSKRLRGVSGRRWHPRKPAAFGDEFSLIAGVVLFRGAASEGGVHRPAGGEFG